MSDILSQGEQWSAQPLFDKIINITLTSKSGYVTYITMPEKGRKPSITIAGNFVSDVACPGMTVRIVNFSSNVDLSDYTLGGTIDMVVGYASSSDNASFKGELQSAYQEKPGPDGVTVFTLLVGSFYSWTSMPISLNYKSGTQINTIITSMANSLSYWAKRPIHVVTNIPDSDTIQASIQEDGTGMDIAHNFRQFLGITIQPDGDVLRAYYSDSDIGLVHKVTYVTTVNKIAGGYSITGPLIPSIRPADLIYFDPKYFRQQLGGAVTIAKTYLRVQTMAFQFSTIGDTNTMTLLAL